MANEISWVPIITALAGISGALGSQYLSHRFARQRETIAATVKKESERFYITTELIFILERFAQSCVFAAQESGEYDQDGRIEMEYFLPEINYDSVTGDWRSLPPGLMYRLVELPVLCQEAHSLIIATFNEDTPYDGSSSISELNHHAAWLGLKALRLSRGLRQLCDMPDNGLSDQPWSAWSVLFRERWNSIQRRNRSYRRHKVLYESLG